MKTIPAKLISMLAAALVCLAPAAAAAEPFLGADPQTDATVYRIRLSADDGATWGAWTQGPSVNNVMRFDLGGTSPGDYDGQAQAGALITVRDTTTGQTTTAPVWSASAPFELRVPTIRAPAQVAIQAPTTAGSGN